MARIVYQAARLGWAVEDLPELTGSPRQIAWALRIRRDATRELQPLINRLGIVTGRLSPEERKARNIPAFPEWPAVLTANRLGLVFARQEAAWWIDRRANPLELLNTHGEMVARDLRITRAAPAPVARTLLRADEATDELRDAQRVVLDGWLLLLGAEGRAKAVLGITANGSLHEQSGRHYKREPLAVDPWDGAIETSRGPFLPAPGERRRVGLPAL